MDSSQGSLAKSIFQAVIHGIDLENPLQGENALTRFVWERFLTGFANYAVRLLARQKLLWRIERCEEETARFGSVMRIYNQLPQEEEDEINRKFAETVNILEIVQVNNHAMERIIFGTDSGHSSE